MTLLSLALVSTRLPEWADLAVERWHPSQTTSRRTKKTYISLSLQFVGRAGENSTQVAFALWVLHHATLKKTPQ
jgi:hypothetical protein